MRIFEVYDEEWSAVYGEEQLKNFVIDHILNDDKEDLQDRACGTGVESLIQKIYNTKFETELTVEQALMLLEPMLFECKELVVY
jgi:hypothetical protein